MPTSAAPCCSSPRYRLAGKNSTRLLWNWEGKALQFSSVQYLQYSQSDHGMLLLKECHKSEFDCVLMCVLLAKACCLPSSGRVVLLWGLSIYSAFTVHWLTYITNGVECSWIWMKPPACYRQMRKKPCLIVLVNDRMGLKELVRWSSGARQAAEPTASMGNELGGVTLVDSKACCIARPKLKVTPLPDTPIVMLSDRLSAAGFESLWYWCRLCSGDDS